MTGTVNRAQRTRSLVLHLVCVVVGALIVVPVWFGVLGGFKDNGQLSTNPLGWPDPWTPSNYTDILTSGVFWRQLGNSLLIAVSSTFIVVAAAAMAAFVFARYAFRGREFLVTLFAIGLMFPFAVAILPLFVLLRGMGLLDNPLGVILPQAAFGLPITIIILRQFFRTIPAEVEEAAVLDGCGSFGFFWRVLLPMARPALATVSVLAVVTSWNNFMLPLVVFTDQSWWTLPVGVQAFQGQYTAETARVLAYVVLSMVPALGFYAVAERQLIGGLTGSVKG
ncbi:carbohydrate ABC transporter permease [Micromonospora vinacea]|uniref:Raffinose/stachyose/melibiose transport system permease protein n=1 Tax=Micromonospora vinacea TaxID=709878 RepID=A0ABS0K9Q1_9ACTN|nr:carbohydrate ABC transporter permease [Micromonospora vinacea]MBG6105366.1 raffinose/stachyose/melibiose transport system permease protein [Micromonospora vinacea]WSZ78453.1 carbohydrate ABC transporter permease [Micromonospora sp. NBC_00860]WTA65117.1 carbohydrate ABC transporter permease [Micromonospora sp. NBC_00855]